MSTKAMLSSAAAGAAMLLTACARQPPPALPLPASVQPVARHAAPPQPRVRQASQAKPVRTGGVVPDEGTQRDCAYQGLLAEDHAQDEDPSALGLNSVLAGQSLRDACLRASRRSARPSEEP